MADPYGIEARARFVAEPPKRAGRSPFERDRARIVHSSALRRLSAKTQVMTAGTHDFVRNRLTHSLEVAQVARELGGSLGCDPDIVDSAALAHDLGHPPFGHNGEAALDSAAEKCGGFEGNAQTLRLLSRLEGKTFAADGRSVGLNLTRATLAACIKYPWLRGEGPLGFNPRKFGVYADDADIFAFVIDDLYAENVNLWRKPIEAEVMDLSDDVAYSVHDIEDGVVGGWFTLDPAELDLVGVHEAAADWYDAAISSQRLIAALERLEAMAEWPRQQLDGSRESRAALKSLTSALIGRFVTATKEATIDAWGSGPLSRYGAQLEVPAGTRDEITALKSVAAHYIMRSADRSDERAAQRELIANLVEALLGSEGQELDADLRADFEAAPDDNARLRVVVDQVASLTDISAPMWASRLF
ncbi:MAG TPA: deoxyguanosinetriphosphate triphosphohydrolase [Aeromicrobium sp.]|nr:deoxyguanosinetriphosphate triphosphohydrolase [Aeromicrobium sp.]